MAIFEPSKINLQWAHSASGPGEGRFDALHSRPLRVHRARAGCMVINNQRRTWTHLDVLRERRLST